MPRLNVLGPITIRVAGVPLPVPARLDRSVLVHLLLAEGRALSVELLIEAVWGQRPPIQARNALQVKISRLRALLGDDGAGLAYRAPTGSRSNMTRSTPGSSAPASNEQPI